MNNKYISLIICCLVVLFVCSACTREKGKHTVDKNVIKDYVRNPLNQAEGMKSELEGKQDRMKQQADLLVGE